MRQHRSERSAEIPHVAPERLRQRVLGAVRGEGYARPGEHARISRRGRRVLGGSIAVLAALLATGLFALERSAPVGRPRTRSATTLSARTTRAHLRRAGPRAELIVSGMPEPPVGEVYEVWLNRPSAPPRPTDALFTVTSEGNAAVEVPGSLRGVREITVTSEPLGGSASPTSAPVLRLPVTKRA
jgi:hypothetical protein